MFKRRILVRQMVKRNVPTIGLSVDESYGSLMLIKVGVRFRNEADRCWSAMPIPMPKDPAFHW